MPQLFETMVNFFTTDEWPFVRFDNRPALRLGFTGDNGNWLCYADAREETGYFLFFSVCPVNVPPAKRTAMAEFICRANYGLPIGNFEMDVDDGEVRFKTGIDTEDTQLTDPIIRNLVYANVLAMDRYLPGIMNVIYSEMSPAEAIERIEGEPAPVAPRKEQSRE